LSACTTQKRPRSGAGKHDQWLRLSCRDIDQTRRDIHTSICRNPRAVRSALSCDRLIYVGLIFSICKHFENISFRARCGFIDNESWTAWSEHVLMYFNQPGAKMCWELRSGSFNARFRNFVDSSPVPKVPTMV